MSIAAVLQGTRSWWIEQTDVLAGLRAMPDESVQCVVTSPPYWGLRSYSTEPQVWGGDPSCPHGYDEIDRRSVTGGHGTSSAKQVSNVGSQFGNAWQGDTLNGTSATRRPSVSAQCSLCGAWRGELGSEPTIALYVEHMVMVFREIRRVLRKDGVAFCNIGDSYASTGTTGGSSPVENRNPEMYGRNGYGGDHVRGRVPERKTLSDGLKAKDACLIPFRLALALQADGWWVRQPIIWSKPNPMPESVTDRCTTSHEYILHLTKSARYFWDADAIRTPLTDKTLTTFGTERHLLEGADESVKENNWARDVPVRKPKLKMPDGWDTGEGGHGTQHRNGREKGQTYERDMLLGANARSVWEIATEAFSKAHFATYPTELVRRCVLAGSRPGDLVLDPFSGSGTTVMVALRHGRRGIGLELNPEYVAMAKRRVEADAPLWNTVP